MVRQRFDDMLAGYAISVAKSALGTRGRPRKILGLTDCIAAYYQHASGSGKCTSIRNTVERDD